MTGGTRRPTWWRAIRGRTRIAGSTRCTGTSGASLQPLEDARTSGQRRGLIAHDAAGRVARLDLLPAPEPPPADRRPRRRFGRGDAALLDGVLRDARSRHGERGAVLRVPCRRPSLEGALARRRFDVRSISTCAGRCRRRRAGRLALGAMRSAAALDARTTRSTRCG